MFTLTQKAKSDLKNIAKYTQKQWGRKQRNQYVKQLDDTFHFLASNPKYGIRCDYIKIGYYKYIVAKHVIFYRYVDNKMQIVRILHQSMDTEGGIGF